MGKSRGLRNSRLNIYIYILNFFIFLRIEGAMTLGLYSYTSPIPPSLRIALSLTIDLETAPYQIYPSKLDHGRKSKKIVRRGFVKPSAYWSLLDKKYLTWSCFFFFFFFIKILKFLLLREI
jgi:hypothetical protein